MDVARLADQLASTCLEKIQPPIRPNLDIVTIEDLAVVAAQVPAAEARDLPVFVRSLGLTGGAFLRTHDGNRAMNAFEVHALQSRRGQPQDDRDPVEECAGTTPGSHAVAALLQRVRAGRSAFGGFSDEQVLEMLGVRRSEPGKGSALTLAGVLALGAYPQQVFPQLNTTFVVFPTADGSPTRDGTRFLDNESIDGAVPAQIQGALRAIRRNMKMRAQVIGLLREDVPEYPEEALREVIANALLHRDYSSLSRGTQVRIEMYPDRLVVTSPGGLFGGVNESELMSEPVSSSRNAHLAKLLEDVEVPGTGRAVCENRGSGLLAVAASLRRAGMQPPEIRSDLTHFRVILRNHTLMDDETLRWLAEQVESGLSDQQKLGLALARRTGEINNGDYRALTGADAATASRDLAQIADGGWIARRGGRKYARWVFVAQDGVETDHESATLPMQQDVLTREETVRRFLAAGPRSARELAEAVGVARPSRAAREVTSPRGRCECQRKCARLVLGTAQSWS